jgi:hypothetical protein
MKIILAALIALTLAGCVIAPDQHRNCWDYHHCDRWG